MRTLFPVASVAVVLAVVGFKFWGLPPGSGAEAPQPEGRPAESTQHIEHMDATTAEPGSFDELLSHPNVERYLAREARKEKLQGYFNDEQGSDADSAWKLIEEVEGEGGMLAYEALALKLAWLEKNSESKAEFDQASEALLESYRTRAQQATEQYDPYRDVPGFAQYKEMETRIVAEVQGMTSFPEGMSRQEYLRNRLQEAREQAYSGE